MNPDRLQVLRAVAGWLVLAALGLWAYLALLPADEPDRAAARTLTADAAVDRARGYLAARNLMPGTDAVPRARLLRDAILLDSLQRRFGRLRATRLLRSPEGARIPAYYWQVSWAEAPAEGFRGDAPPEQRRVRLSLDGRLLGLDAPLVRPETVSPDGSAARSVYARDEGATLPDSLLAGLRFALPGEPPANAPTPAALVLPGPSAAEALARYHLRRTPLGAWRFAVDSVRAATRPGLDAARVYLSTREPGLPVLHAEAEVTASGALLSLDHHAATREDRADRTARVSASSARGIVMGAGFVVAAVLLLLSFLRRLNARLVDTRAAARDGLLGGVLFGTWIFIVVGPNLIESAPTAFWAAFILAVNVVLVGLTGGLLVMAASGVAGSVAQPVFPEKLFSLTLLRRGALHDVRVGRAFLRGGAAAFALLGAFAAALRFLPGVVLHTDTDDATFVQETVFSLVGHALTWNVGTALFAVLGVALPLQALAGARVRARWAYGAAATAALALMLPTFSAFGVQAELVLMAFTAAVAVALLVRYDALTAVVALAVVGLLWETREGWIVPGADAYTDSLIAFAFAGVLLLLGAGGAIAGREAATATGLVPLYLREHEQESRMKRELDIARTVQQRFLPQKTPRVPGIDVAATCLPAYEVGGDLYDFIEITPTRFAFCVGDVSGKGVQAAFVMTIVKGILQTLAREDHAPVHVMRRLNSLFRINVPRGSFISMIYGVLDADARTLTFARAGHNPLIRHCAGCEAPELVRPKGVVIGLAREEAFDVHIEEVVVPLGAGDVLVLYTDGFSEAMNVRHDLFTDERVAGEVAKASGGTAHQILTAAVESVTAFAGEAPQHDDMTMVVFKVGG